MRTPDRDQIPSWIWERRDIEPFEKLLLATIGFKADADGWFRGCLDELAQWTALEPAYIETDRLKLIQRGLLVYSDEPENVTRRECTSHWCSPDARIEHPQRVRLYEPLVGTPNGVAAGARAPKQK